TDLCMGAHRLCANSVVVRRERQNFDLLAVFEFLQANFDAVFEFNSISVRVGFRKKLAESDRLIGAQAMGLLKSWRYAVDHELGPVGNAYRAGLALGSKEFLQCREHPFGWRGWLTGLRRRQSF